jgi:two-component system, cell cycle sensor histidine kinase and response regulator CckA
LTRQNSPSTRRPIESIGRLAGGVAHDFNNLLTAILGNTELAMEDLDPHGKPYQHLSTIAKAAEGAAALTRQLLAFSRKQILEPRVVNANDLIVRLSNVLATLVGENIALHVVPAEGLYSIKVDPGQFEQIVLNLAANARDAMPNGGKLLVETANRLLDDEYCRAHAGVVPGDYVMIAVSDTGSGMSADVLAHLFEPFFTTKEKGKGTGLGLATVYGIVKQNGGTIEAYSEVDHGTTFEIDFPRTLLASGYTAEAIDRHGILEHGLSFLAKPFSVRSLAERVREVLDGPFAS